MASNANQLISPRAGTFLADAVFTRPDDVIAYTALDAVSGSTTVPEAMEFSCARLAGNGFRVTGATLLKSAASLTNASYRLLLFLTEPAAASFLDNEAAAFSAAELVDLLGTIDFVTGTHGVSIGVGAVYNRGDVQIAAVPDEDTKSIFGVLLATGAYTPAALETFRVTLSGFVD